MTPDRWTAVAAILAAFVALAWLTACWFTVRARRDAQYRALRARLFEVGEEMVREGYFR